MNTTRWIGPIPGGPCPAWGGYDPTQDHDTRLRKEPDGWYVAVRPERDVRCVDIARDAGIQPPETYYLEDVWKRRPRALSDDAHAALRAELSAIGIREDEIAEAEKETLPSPWADDHLTAELYGRGRYIDDQGQPTLHMSGVGCHPLCPKPRPWRPSEGCHADGTLSLGHEHIREVLAVYLTDIGGTEACMLADLLRGPALDDASEEDAALELLSEHTGQEWYLSEGDLMCGGREPDDEPDYERIAQLRETWNG